MEVIAYDAGANKYELSGVGPFKGIIKRGAVAAQISTEMPKAAESQTADQQLASGSQGSEDAAPATEPADAMATFAAFANHTAEFLLCTKTGRFRTWGYFSGSVFVHGGEIYVADISKLGMLGHYKILCRYSWPRGGPGTRASQRKRENGPFLECSSS